MLDLDNIDIEEFSLKIESLDSLMVSRESINRSIKAIRDDIANVLGISKKKVTPVLNMFTNLRQEGEPFDEDLADRVKELYNAHREKE